MKFDKQLETVFLLTGSDAKIHLYKEDSVSSTFDEVTMIDLTPITGVIPSKYAFKNNIHIYIAHVFVSYKQLYLFSICIFMDIRSIIFIDNLFFNSTTFSAFGCQNGIVQLTVSKNSFDANNLSLRRQFNTSKYIYIYFIFPQK